VEAGKELTSLDTKSSNRIKSPRLTVMTWDEKRGIEKHGMTIVFQPLYEWLCEKTKDE